MRQSLVEQRRELIIVDNASNPPVSQNLPVSSAWSVIREEKLGLTAARERAARVAGAGVVVFVDDDNVLAPDYLERALASMEADDHIGVMSGWVEPEYERKTPRWFTDFEDCVGVRRPADAAFLPAGLPYSEVFPIGAGMVVRREVLLEYFGSLTADTRVEGRVGNALSSGEDLDIDLFAMSRGWKVGVSRALRLTHVIRSHRLNEAYVTALLSASLQSSYAIEHKWRAHFGRAIFAQFERPRTLIALRQVAFGACAFLPGFRIRFRTESTLARLLAGSRRDGGASLSTTHRQGRHRESEEEV
jgi:GT2 family glycosyltransferase